MPACQPGAATLVADLIGGSREERMIGARTFDLLQQ